MRYYANRPEDSLHSTRGNISHDRWMYGTASDRGQMLRTLHTYRSWYGSPAIVVTGVKLEEVALNAVLC